MSHPKERSTTHRSDVRLAVETLQNARVLVTSLGPAQMRVVFHRDVDDNGLDRAVDAFTRVGKSLEATSR